jgi:hypothetical protein
MTPINYLRLSLLALTCSFAPASVHAADSDAPAVEPPVGKAKLLMNIDFESTPVGEIPPGFTKSGMVGVVDDVAHSGKKSLKMEAAVNGARTITVKDADFLKALGGEHWGRLYYKVQLPAPHPQGEGKFPVIHSTLVSGTAQSPSEHDPIEVRMLGMVEGPKDTFQFLYNVQPRKRAEFGKGTPYDYQYTDKWTLAEWYVDYKTQTYRLFIDGQEVKGASFSKGEGKFEKAEIPEVFESLSFGWTNYQKADKGFVAWIDDIALSKEQIGDRGIKPATKKK